MAQDSNHLPRIPTFGQINDPATTSPGPQTQREWTDFYRALNTLRGAVVTLAGQSLPPNAFPAPFGGHSGDAGEVLALLAGHQVPPEHGGGQMPPQLAHPPQNQCPQVVERGAFPAIPYRIPSIYPTVVDTIANQTNYPAASYPKCLYLASDTFLLYYSDATNWIELTPTMGGSYPTQDVTGTFPDPKLNTTGVSAGSYGDDTNVGQFSVDAKGRLTGAASVPITFPAVTAGDIIAALGYTPAVSGGAASFTLSADLVTGDVTGSITQV